MNDRRLGSRIRLLAALAMFAASSNTLANTLNQNVSWTIDRAGTTTKYRVVAYGDSIYAGYNGSITQRREVRGDHGGRRVPVGTRGTPTSRACAAPSRARSPPTSTTTRSSPSARTCRPASTRVVTFEMCGNDGLQARSSFKSQTGTCNYGVLDTAVANCKTYVAAAMDYINANAYAGTKLKVVANLYYPGYNADNVQSSCTDATTGATVNLRDHVPAGHRAR